MRLHSAKTIEMFKTRLMNKCEMSALSRNPAAVYMLENNLDNVDWFALSRNPCAVHILKQNLNKVSWYGLSQNPNAIHILENNIDKVDWHGLSQNPNAIHILERNFPSLRSGESLNFHVNSFGRSPENSFSSTLRSDEKMNLDKIDWIGLSLNPNAIHILERNLDKVDWFYLSLNPNAVHILEQNWNKINWYNLSQNPNAIHILEKNFNKINWDRLSSNPNAIHILEQNLNKINWFNLSQNPNAIHILEKKFNMFGGGSDQAQKGFFGMERIKRYAVACEGEDQISSSLRRKIAILEKLYSIYSMYLLSNPNALHLLFEYDYEYMRITNHELCREIIEHVFHPTRIQRMASMFDMELDEYIESNGWN
jgi:hypothetical protein